MERKIEQKEEMRFLKFKDLQGFMGKEVWLYRGLEVFEGPLTLVKLNKQGQAVVLSDFKLKESIWPTKAINHREHGRFRSTCFASGLAVLKDTD
jgi:hypothetical protein